MSGVTSRALLTKSLKVPLQAVRRLRESSCFSRLRRRSCFLQDSQSLNSTVNIKARLVELSCRVVPAAYRTLERATRDGEFAIDGS